MKRIEFKLTMPKASSWNGKWSGESRNYTLVKELPFDHKLGIELRCSLVTKYWSYAWPDGWVAQIQARAVPNDEKLPSRDGGALDWRRHFVRHGSWHQVGDMAAWLWSARTGVDPVIPRFGPLGFLVLAWLRVRLWRR